MTTHEIKPQEFHILNDRYVIKTRCPRDEITAPMIRTRADRENLPAGAEITVQVYDHAYEIMYAEATYYVTKRKDELHTQEIDDVRSKTSEKSNIGIQLRGVWWVTEYGKRYEKEIAAALEETAGALENA